MVTVAILAILAALAAPNFKGVIQRYEVRTAVEDLVSAIYLARTEAIKRGGKVTLRKATASGCQAPTVQEWSCGWQLFEDRNENGTLNSGTDTAIQQSPVPRNVNVLTKKGSGSGPDHYTFDAWGESGMGVLAIYVRHVDDAASDLDVMLCMSSGGRLRRIPGATECPT